MTALTRGTTPYNQRMVEIANEVRGKLDPKNWPPGETDDGILWADVYDHIYGAMSESNFTSGGALVTPETGHHVRQPLRP